jgi:serine/threonine protein kinase
MIHQAMTEGSPRGEDGPLQIGARFLDKYEIRREIGHGGQASIYLGQHIFTAREVAIKIIHSPRGVTREMLLRGKSEARALGKLDHPNIVVMHDAGVTDEGLFYIVMELLRGHSLRAALTAHGRLGVEELLRLAIQAGEAVQAAHEVPMIHRDLKPDNIYITKGNRLKVLDFGIAKLLNEIGFTTRKDVVIGSLLYMSPEQVLGLPITAQSDICALGLMMFEALIGKHPSLLVFERDLSQRREPYRQATLADMPPIQVSRMPPSLSELDPDIPNHVAQVVQRAMAKVAEDRFSSMRDFVSALHLCLDTVCAELPLRLRSASERDLSQPIFEASEAPDSQRATPKRGIVWNGADSFTTSALPVLGSARAAPQAELARKEPALVALGARYTAHRRSLAERMGPVRNAIIGGCLFGASLGTLGALLHFGTASKAATQARELASTPASVRLTELEPESPAPGVTTVASVVPSPPPPAQAVHSSALTAHIRPSPARATTPARSADKMAQETVQVESGLDSDPSKSPQPSSSEARRKLINGGRLIYGD